MSYISMHFWHESAWHVLLKTKQNVYYISNNNNNEMFFWNTSRENVFSWHIKPRPANLLTRSEMHMISEVNCADSAVSTIDVEMLRSWVDFLNSESAAECFSAHQTVCVWSSCCTDTNTTKPDVLPSHSSRVCVSQTNSCACDRLMMS